MIRIIVVGGGAAGMMAALSAKNADTRVILLEKNPVTIQLAVITVATANKWFNDRNLLSQYRLQ